MTSPNALHPDEIKARNELAACYRIFHHLGWTELIYNHITVRLPDSVTGGERQFLINPFGLHYSEVTASNLVRIDVHGNIIGDCAYRVNPAGFTVHAALHQGLAGAHCVMHTHTTAGSAVAGSVSGLTMNNFYAAQLHQRVAYHDFEGITIVAEEGPRLLKNIAGKHCVILRNHGLLTWGQTVALALAYLWTLQRACEIQLASSALGAVRPISDAVLEQCAKASLQFDPNYGAGQDIFDALLRQVEHTQGHNWKIR
jgi:ribulose-5-phosphate 4-epimerase/fuculose-1-phosphate aldolase